VFIGSLIARIRNLREHHETMAGLWVDEMRHWMQRAEAAEAKSARLEAALRALVNAVDASDICGTGLAHLLNEADNALSGQEG
jgi:hypothetical protein